MNTMDFSFEPTVWEQFRFSKQMGDVVDAADLLTMLEAESEQALEEALQDMEEGCMILSIASLPKFSGHGEAALRLRQEVQFVKNGMKPNELDPADPLRLYLEEVAATPVYADENLLAAESAEGNENAMIMLTNLGLSRVITLAGEHTGYGVLLMDLIQEGSLGLWQAIRCYRNGDFAAHRDRWIRFYMAKAVTLQARQSGVGQKLRNALEDYRAVDEQLLGELGRNPTLEEIAQGLHMSLEETAAVQKMLDNAKILAQVKKPEKEEEQPAEEEEQAVENTALFQMRQRILDMLSSLDEQDAQLLTLRFGLEGGKPLSPDETGRKLGLTPEDVISREAAALAALRHK